MQTLSYRQRRPYNSLERAGETLIFPQKWGKME